MVRRFRLPLLLAAFAAAPAVAQDPPAAVKPAAKAGPEGIWEGPLKVGPLELRLAFKVTKDKDGKLAATMTSIDQGGAEVACKEAAFEGKTLTLGLPRIKARFVGDLAADGQSVKGKFEQAGTPFPLDLKRVEKISTLHRPQTPKPPFPYKAEDVTFENPAAKIKLAGTLTLPKGDGPFPAAVLISGSGPQDRDETLFGHKPFLVLADHLTRHGVAVLRYDDRGVGKSAGKQSGATSADFATDAHAAVTYLKGRKEIDGKKIGLIGHSEGGVIAPLVAADRPADVGFVVLLAGPGVPGGKIATSQYEAMSLAGGEPAAKVKVGARIVDAMVAAALADGPADTLKDRIKAAADKLYESLPAADKKLLGDKDDAKAEDAGAARMADPWMVWFLRFDPRPTLAKVACPVLAVNGEFDTQVLPKLNLPAIEAAVKAGGNPRVTVKELPGLNHLFQPTKTGALSEYGQIEQTMAPEFLEVVTAWVVGLK